MKYLVKRRACWVYNLFLVKQVVRVHSSCTLGLSVHVTQPFVTAQSSSLGLPCMFILPVSMNRLRASRSPAGWPALAPRAAFDRTPAASELRTSLHTSHHPRRQR